MRINARFVGAGGQGVILSSVLLARAYGLGENYYISQSQSYGPEARGGACKSEVVISNEKIDYMKVDDANVFVAFNQIGYDKYKEDVTKDAMVLVNSTLVETDDPDAYRVPATEIAEKMGRPFVINMVMLGALTKLMPKLRSPKVEEEIMKSFAASIAGFNLRAYEQGYEAMEKEVKAREEEAEKRRYII